MKTRMKVAWKHPHIRAIAWTVIVFLVTGVASVLLFECCGAISAILASISAGCVTGIVFFAITNIRNNVLQGIKEEYEEAGKQYQLARKTIKLCSDTIQNAYDSKRRIADICRNLDGIITYMSTLCFDAPRMARLIKDYPPDYVDRMKSVRASKEVLQNVTPSGEEEQILRALEDIMLFCSATEDILLEPWLKLATEAAHFEQSVL